MEPELLVDANIVETANRVFTTIAKHRWLLLSTSAVVFATLGFIAQSQPLYSEKNLSVVRQPVPRRYATSTSTTDIREALHATTQEVLSRTCLLETIAEFGPYAKEKERLSP